MAIRKAICLFVIFASTLNSNIDLFVCFSIYFGWPDRIFHFNYIEQGLTRVLRTKISLAFQWTNSNADQNVIINCCNLTAAYLASDLHVCWSNSSIRFGFVISFNHFRCRLSLSDEGDNQLMCKCNKFTTQNSWNRNRIHANRTLFLPALCGWSESFHSSWQQK